MTEIEKIIDLHLQELYSIRQFSELTIDSYKIDLRQFSSFLKSINIDAPKDVSEKSLRMFLVHLSENNLSRASISRKLSCIRSFINFAKKNNYLEKDPTLFIQNPKIKRKIPDVLPLDSYKEIIKFNFGNLKNEKILLLKAIFEILYGCAIRVAELCSLNLSDIDFDRNVISVLGKGSKQRYVPIGEISVPIVKEYIKHRDFFKPNSIALFINNNGERVNSRWVQRVVKKYISLVSDIKKKSPHVLRHSAATHMLDRGADLLTVKEILGHENLSTTQIYTHVSIEHLKNSYKKAHPKS
ncbi:MAG: tyrosine recombinase XerD [Ignavibacteriales bacterium CG_4_9_14_3_um_filter_34_10]|nr:MAG: tyrosine recombinase XerD [Ignavibacteriales bacterium CG_4_9_14_3_um_filter_34_10]